MFENLNVISGGTQSSVKNLTVVDLSYANSRTKNAKCILSPDSFTKNQAWKNSGTKLMCKVNCLKLQLTTRSSNSAASTLNTNNKQQTRAKIKQEPRFLLCFFMVSVLIKCEKKELSAWDTSCETPAPLPTGSHGVPRKSCWQLNSYLTDTETSFVVEWLISKLSTHFLSTKMSSQLQAVKLAATKAAFQNVDVCLGKCVCFWPSRAATSRQAK